MRAAEVLSGDVGQQVLEAVQSLGVRMDGRLEACVHALEQRS